MLGVAETLIAQESWDEAGEDCEGALLRFNQADDQLGRADAELALGLIQHGKNEFDEALKHFEQALELYQHQPQPLSEADTRYERAGILLIHGKLDQALADLDQAIILVERVMKTLASPAQWQHFLRQYTELYAQKAITLARLEREGEGQTCLKGFVQIAGIDEIKAYLQTFEASIPVQSEGLNEVQIAENQALLKRLKQIRKGW
jgi:tetratricopeptide (TPR) repeat protein